MPSETHEVDPNMRAIDLPFRVSPDGTLVVDAPPSGNVAPPGPYYLFVDRGTGADAVPSTAAVVYVGHDNPHPAPIPAGLPAAPRSRAPSRHGLLGHFLLLLSEGFAIRL